jgi:hypothetical protein
MTVTTFDKSGHPSLQDFVPDLTRTAPPRRSTGRNPPWQGFARFLQHQRENAIFELCADLLLIDFASVNSCACAPQLPPARLTGGVLAMAALCRRVSELR